MSEIAYSSVVIVHPIRLFSEVLAGIVTNAKLKLEHVSTDIDDIPFEKISGVPLFIVGGRTPGHLADNVRSIKECFPCSRIVAIGSPGVPQAVVMALEAGACSYLHDEMTFETLVMGLKLVLNDTSVLPPSAIEWLARSHFREAMTSQTLIRALQLVLDDEIILPPEEEQHLSARATKPGGLNMRDQESALQSKRNGESPLSRHCAECAQLSAREAVVLQALIEGAPNKVIAQNLQIAEATVKVHVAAVLRKIRVKNRTQAAIWAIKTSKKTQ